MVLSFPTSSCDYTKPVAHAPGDPTSRIWSTSRTNDEIESRSAFAAAVRRSLRPLALAQPGRCALAAFAHAFAGCQRGPAGSQPALVGGRARSVIALRSVAISSTVPVGSASCSATLAMSSRVVTFYRSVRRAFGRAALGLDQPKWCLTAQAPLVVMEQWWFSWSIFVMRPHTSLNTPRMYAEKATSLRIQGARRKKSGLTACCLSKKRLKLARRTREEALPGHPRKPTDEVRKLTPMATHTHTDMIVLPQSADSP